MTDPRRGTRGQVVVLFAIVVVALLGITSLTVDIGGFYAEVRHERSVADAAALAGAQVQFRAGSLSVSNTEWTTARTTAMRTAIGQLDRS